MPAQGGWSASAASNAVMNETKNGYDAIFVGGGRDRAGLGLAGGARGARVCVLEPSGRRPARPEWRRGCSRRWGGLLGRGGAARAQPGLVARAGPASRRAGACRRRSKSASRSRRASRRARPRRGREPAPPLRPSPAARARLRVAAGRACREARARARHRRPRRARTSPARRASIRAAWWPPCWAPSSEGRGVRSKSGARGDRGRADLPAPGDWRRDDGGRSPGHAVVLAAGCWSGQLDWIPPEARPPVRPVKGEILTLRGPADEPVCERIVAGERVYIVPRGRWAADRRRHGRGDAASIRR